MSPPTFPGKARINNNNWKSPLHPAKPESTMSPRPVTPGGEEGADICGVGYKVTGSDESRDMLPLEGSRPKEEEKGWEGAGKGSGRERGEGEEQSL